MSLDTIFPFEPTRQNMIVFTAMRDFADGLTRGLSLFLTERQDTTAKTLWPTASARAERRR
jgi:hypothetical protein